MSVDPTFFGQCQYINTYSSVYYTADLAFSDGPVFQHRWPIAKKRKYGWQQCYKEGPPRSLKQTRLSWKFFCLRKIVDPWNFFAWAPSVADLERVAILITESNNVASFSPCWPFWKALTKIDLFRAFIGRKFAASKEAFLSREREQIYCDKPPWKRNDVTILQISKLSTSKLHPRSLTALGNKSWQLLNICYDKNANKLVSKTLIFACVAALDWEWILSFWAQEVEKVPRMVFCGPFFGLFGIFHLPLRVKVIPCL